MTGGSDPAVRAICQVTIPGLKQEAGESSGHLVPVPPVQDTQGFSGVCPGGGSSVAGPRAEHTIFFVPEAPEVRGVPSGRALGAWTLNSCGEDAL